MNCSVRHQIIQTATDCFAKFGIKNTSMDLISTLLYISKRTLYQHFRSKRELLMCCMKERIEQDRGAINEQMKGKQSLEAIVSINYTAFRLLASLYPAFRRDVLRYKNIMGLIEKELHIPLRDACRQLIEQAKLDELVLPETDAEMVCTFFENNLLYCPAEKIHENMSETIYKYSLLTYLSGICTNKGRQLLKTISI